MRRLRNLLLNLLLVAASIAVTLLALEIVLRFLPVARAPAVVAPTTDNPIMRYQANTPFVWSLGWDFYKVVHGRTNSQGFVADYDYDGGATAPLVAVVGDSFIEAMQVPFAKSLTGLLQAEMTTRGRAYAIAQSGAALSAYAAYARHACSTYHPQKLVVSIVGNDFDESVFAHRQRDGLFNLHPRADGSFDWILTPLPAPSLKERIARSSALALYLARNVKIGQLANFFSPTTPARAQGRAWVGNTAASADADRVQEGYRVIDWFLGSLPETACLAPADIVLVVDAPRPELYDDAMLAAAKGTYFELMRSKLLTEARAGGFKTVDLEPVFRTRFARDHRRFENPTDAHWNEDGHATVAAAVRDVMKDWPPLAP